ncbi:MAG: ATP-binding protein [Bacteroidota bacterium]
MKFYNRTSELAILKRVAKQSQRQSRMTIVTGRRRIGKTRLIHHSLSNQVYLYFFIARKDEKLLCQEFTEQIEQSLQTSIFGTITQFKDIFGWLMNYAQQHAITLVIDEFQEFFRINPSIYSDLQNIWDRQKEQSKMNLILSGSVYSLMQKIFENAKEPLFGRTNEKLYIQAFTADLQRLILSDFNPTYSKEDLLTFYILTGGIPKYIEQFIDNECFTKTQMLNEVFHENSFFLDEGKNVLIEEFGKEYTTYSSILSLIAASKTSRSAIESILQKDIGGYLSRLEKDYRIIERHSPIFSKPGTRNVKFLIKDHFLSFWFRFIYKYKGAVEIRNFDYLRQVVDRDFPTFSGLFLERFIKEQLAATKRYALIGSYWERANQNQIDIVALNDLDKTALIAEVKLQSKNISIDKLKEKAYALKRKLNGYQISYKGFSLEDVLERKF